MNFKRILIGIVLFSIASAVASADWNMFRHNLNHTGYTNESFGIKNNMLWNYTTGGPVVSSPAIAGNMVIFGSYDYKLYALNSSPLSMPPAERLIWNFTAPNLIFSSPVVAENMVFFGSVRELSGESDGYLNETTGQWAKCDSLNGHDECSSFSSWCYWNGTICGPKPGYSGFTGIIYAINQSNGKPLWNFSTGGSDPLKDYFYSSPSVENGVVFVGSSISSSRGRIYALNSSTGRLLWNYTIEGGNIRSSPAVSGGMVFIGSNTLYVNSTYTAPGRVYALNSTGELVWNFTTQNLCGTPARAEPCSIFSSPAVFGGMIFFGSDDNYVYALNKSNGNLIWNYSTNNAVKSSPAVAYGKIFIGSMGGKVYALNMSNGNPVWNYSIGAGVGIGSSLAVAGHVVYIGGGNTNVYAFNESTGQLLWTYPTGGFVDSSPAVVSGAENGILFIGSMDNNLYAIGTLYPDLAVVDVNISSGVKDGQITPVNATIENTGEGDAEFKVSFYYDLMAPAYLIGTVTGQVTHFEKENVSVNWDTAGKAGNHTIYVSVEVTSVPDEVNKSNNLASKTVELLYPGRSLRIIPHYGRADLGRDFIVYLNISSDTAINGTVFNLLFNSSILTLKEIKNGDFFTPANHSNYSLITGDLLNATLNFTSGGSASGTGILAEITFNAKETGISALNIENVNFYNNGVMVTGVLPVDGEIKVCIAGDVNCDCTVDINDLMIVAQAFHTKQGDGTYELRADLNGDNVINVFDLAAVGGNYENSC